MSYWCPGCETQKDTHKRLTDPHLCQVCKRKAREDSPPRAKMVRKPRGVEHCDKCGHTATKPRNPRKKGQPYRCHPCRRVAGAPEPCPQCGAAVPLAKWRHNTKIGTLAYCSRDCYRESRSIIPFAPRGTIEGETQRRSHDRRRERDRAPGLNVTQRRFLLAKWVKRGRKCFYCESADVRSVDHVIPLSRGGTNYEGNLVPCCKSCNSSKHSSTVTEWRVRLRRRADRAA